jgi:hypothetical protein
VYAARVLDLAEIQPDERRLIRRSLLGAGPGDLVSIEAG